MLGLGRQGQGQRHPYCLCHHGLGLSVSLTRSQRSVDPLLVLDLSYVFKALPWLHIWFLKPSKAVSADSVLVGFLTEPRVVPRPLLRAQLVTGTNYWRQMTVTCCLSVLLAHYEASLMPRFPSHALSPFRDIWFPQVCPL